MTDFRARFAERLIYAAQRPEEVTMFHKAKTRVLLVLGRCPDCTHRYGHNARCDECLEARR